MEKCARCGYVNNNKLGNKDGYRPTIDHIKKFYNFPNSRRWVLCTDIAKELGYSAGDSKRIGKALRYLGVPFKRMSRGVYFFMPLINNK